MPLDIDAYHSILGEIQSHGAQLIAVSKTKSAELVRELYELGQRDFGENYVQELDEKRQALPADIRWHFIGHLQSNKAKTICPYIQLVHGVDSLSLVTEIGKQSAKQNRTTDVLLQIFIATEETKFGLSETEATEIIESLIKSPVPGIRIRGLMGMATLTDDEKMITREFRSLRRFFDTIKMNTANVNGFFFDSLSMGMTSDYRIALAEGSNMVRIGSAIFGPRG